jgi:thioredoxin reductase
MPTCPAKISTAVAIIGSGPAGLAAAAQLARHGITDIVIIERDDAAGGLPRFCHHPGFGWEYSHRLDTGPRFVKRLIQALPRTTRVLLRTTALSITLGPVVDIVGPETGPASIRAKAVLIATGIREQSRGGRLVAGSRPEHGILTTGLLQQLIARGVPIKRGRMVVVGTEHVAFSAILTGRRAGIRTIAMIESQERPGSWPIAALIARGAGVGIHPATEIVEILGRSGVGSVVVRDRAGQARSIPCEYVLFSGSWIPESPLVSQSGGRVDDRTGGPVVDQFLRTSLPAVFAAGNVLRPVESSGRAALEGALAAKYIVAFLTQRIGSEIGNVTIEVSPPFSYVVPQRWAAEPSDDGVGRFSLRSTAEGFGRIVLSAGDTPVYRSGLMRIQPNRQIRLTPRAIEVNAGTKQLKIEICSASR